MKQSWIGLPVESYKAGVAYYGASDAVNGFFRVVGTYGHPNQFALILCLMLSLIIPNMFMAKWSKYVVGLIVSIPIIILSQSRSGWISLFSVVILTLFMYKAKILKIINKIGAIRFYLVMILTILGTSVVLFPRLIASYNAFSQSAGATLRIEMQKEALSAIKINPLAGYGIGTNEPILLSLFPNGYVYTFPAPIHMFYLQMALESGLVGLFAFLFPFLYILRCIINMYTQHSQKITLATKNNVFVFLAGFCAFGTYYLFQPHQGYIEFPLIGIILGFGTLFIYNLDYK
jgi:O-antigen ligase